MPPFATKLRCLLCRITISAQLRATSLAGEPPLRAEHSARERTVTRRAPRTAALRNGQFVVQGLGSGARFGRRNRRGETGAGDLPAHEFRYQLRFDSRWFGEEGHRRKPRRNGRRDSPSVKGMANIEREAWFLSRLEGQARERGESDQQEQRGGRPMGEAHLAAATSRSNRVSGSRADAHRALRLSRRAQTGANHRLRFPA